MAKGKPATKKDKFDSLKLEGGKKDLKADKKEAKKTKKTSRPQGRSKVGMMR